MTAERQIPRIPELSRRNFSMTAVGAAATLLAGGSRTVDLADIGTNDPNSYSVLVNKRHPLNPMDFVPADLVAPDVPITAAQPESRLVRAEAAKATEKMFSAAQSEGIQLVIISAYRSYATQKRVFEYYVSRDGQKVAETYSARPGYSEHQSGLTMDIAAVGDTDVLEASFANGPAGIWAAANCHRFGYILRYPQGKQAITGYIFEPWHFRYIGPASALLMKTSGLSTYEEFVGSEPAPDYIDPAS